MKQPDRKALLKKFVNYPAPIRILIRILLSIALIAITASAKSVTFAAMIQYPIHLYSTIVLRITNAPLLEGDSENDWGFSQIVALMTLFATIVEFLRGLASKFSIFDDESDTKDVQEYFRERKLTPLNHSNDEDL